MFLLSCYDSSMGSQLLLSGASAAFGCSLQTKVQLLVLDVKELQLQRDKLGQSSKLTKQKNNAIKHKMCKVREALSELAMWKAMGTDQSADDVRVSQAQLIDMLQGKPAPWELEGLGVGEAAQLHYGRKLFMLKSTADRCSEQLAILRVERDRLRAWLSKQVDTCTHVCGTASTEQQLINATTATARTAAEAWVQYGAGADGHLYLVRQRLRWARQALAQLQKLSWE
jgi:hypothetical protein